MTHICVGILTSIGSDNGLAPSYLNQCWNIVNWTPKNKYQWNFNQNSSIFIQENAFQNFVCEMASIWLGLNELRDERCWIYSGRTQLRAITAPPTLLTNSHSGCANYVVYFRSLTYDLINEICIFVLHSMKLNGIVFKWKWTWCWKFKTKLIIKSTICRNGLSSSRWFICRITYVVYGGFIVNQW